VTAQKSFKIEATSLILKQLNRYLDVMLFHVLVGIQLFGAIIPKFNLAFEIRFLQFVELNYLYLFSPET
jgi:hypothetical protein